MDLIQEVLMFSRDYVNGNRTQERKQKIAAAYRSLLGVKMKVGCSTCYIEAIFKIIKFMEKKSCSFRLKPGALLQGFGDESKTCTNDNLTDELAEYHIKTNPGCIRYFVIPTPEEIQRMFFTPEPELKIVKAKVEIDESKTIIIGQIDKMSEVKVEKLKAVQKPKTAKKPKK